MSVKQIVTVVFSCLLVMSVSGQTNRALFVAIDKYPIGSGWNDIHATNDKEIVLPMLQSAGFNNTNIVCLFNEKATKKAITEELVKLLKRSRQGDYIYIHFSCHGQLMADDNGDEPDGYDEALIPYDAPRRFVKGVYEGNKHLRDDELGLLLDKIREKIGSAGNVTVVLDACHSATANRDTDDGIYIRGTTYIFAPKNYIPVVGEDKNKLKSGPSFAPIAVWSACQSEQSNYEYFDPKTKKYFGSLSYVFCEIVKDSGAKTETIVALNNRIVRRIEIILKGRRYRQTPYLETTNENNIFKIGK